MNKKLKRHIKEMKGMANYLMPYTYPLVDFRDEQDILILKQRSIIVDGYEVVVTLNKSDYGKYHIINLNIKSAQSPFLPFNVVCNLARSFLGSHHLTYAEFLKDNKKIYCWNQKLTTKGQSLPPSEEMESGSYEGFEYNIIRPSVGDVFVILHDMKNKYADTFSYKEKLIMHNSKLRKLQYLLITQLFENGKVNLLLPDGMTVEIGIVQETEKGHVKSGRLLLRGCI